MIFKGKKVLLVGLGTLGGGEATANFILKEGGDLTITDKKNKKELLSSLKKIKGNIKLALGEHKIEDLKNNDIIVFNPAIYIKNKLVALGNTPKFVDILNRLRTIMSL